MILKTVKIKTMKNIFFLLLAIAFCSCTKTVYVNSFSSSRITTVPSELRLMTITNKSQEVVFSDTIFGDVIVVNKVPQDLYVDIKYNIASRSNKKGMQIKIPQPIIRDTYIIWIDDESIVQSRKWTFDETVSCQLIKK